MEVFLEKKTWQFIVAYTEFPKIRYYFVICCGLFCFGTDLFPHILQGYFTGTGAIRWLPQCQWSNPGEYGNKSHGSSKNNDKYNKTSFHESIKFIQQAIMCVCSYRKYLRLE